MFLRLFPVLAPLLVFGKELAPGLGRARACVRAFVCVCNMTPRSLVVLCLWRQIPKGDNLHASFAP